ncbi:M23 family metallopeptidase [Reichenbachiella versicolor]|uniref:M23 family metallopeptidase n=1 Tax=Reichenbachiella versicolor TaxID=1821036 RepID=UPI000D6E70B3|nr:M23 family metallopeptidase [Reichenbachiella versicolor]
MENKKTLSNRLTTKYLLIVRNEENFAEKHTYSFTYAKIILGLFLIFVTLFGLSFYLSTTLLEQWFDPRYAELKANKQVIDLSATLDSVVQEVKRKDAFIENFKLIMSGEDDKYTKVDNEGNLKSSEVKEIVQSEEINPIDSQFRVQFEEVGVDLSLDASAISDEMEDFYLFKPVEGIVSDGFGKDHLAVDIVAKQDEPVKAVADGTVIFASWTQDSGYVMAIQHSGNLLSMYKHNSDLLKNVGNFVSAGEVISIIGNTGELTSGPHLHFELWYNGNPINPEEFIRF